MQSYEHLWKVRIELRRNCEIHNYVVDWETNRILSSLKTISHYWETYLYFYWKLCEIYMWSKVLIIPSFFSKFYFSNYGEKVRRKRAFYWLLIHSHTDKVKSVMYLSIKLFCISEFLLYFHWVYKEDTCAYYCILRVYFGLHCCTTTLCSSIYG